MKQIVNNLLTSGRMGVVMGGKFLWGMITGVAVLAWVFGLWIIGNPCWTIPVWVYVISLLSALGVGITFYIGQKEITRRTENWGKGLEKDMQRARDKIEQLERRIKELEDQ